MTRHGDRAHSTGKCALKTTGGMGQRLALLLGHSIQGMCIEDIWRKRTGNRPAYREPYKGKCTLKPS